MAELQTQLHRRRGTHDSARLEAYAATEAITSHRDYKHTGLQDKADLREVKEHRQEKIQGNLKILKHNSLLPQALVNKPQI